MYYAYTNCYNLTGFPVSGFNNKDLQHTYDNCYNLASNAYFYSSEIFSMRECFNNWPSTKKSLNLYLPANSTSLTSALVNNSRSIIGKTITWTNDMAINGCYYNTAYNIYIYPVDDVAAARTANGDD